jgi:hypothetical protein
LKEVCHVADKGYIGKNLFERLFVDGIQQITARYPFIIDAV